MDEEAYGGELPEEMEGEEGAGEDDTAVRGAGNQGVTVSSSSVCLLTPRAEQELEAMKARLKEMEDEAAKLRAMQASVEKEMGSLPMSTDADREEVDSRSVFVGNVDYAVTPEELQLHFQSCGTVNRVTILTDKSGNPKGFAYVEFLEADAVANALLLNDSELHARKIKVLSKRTNVPGMKQRGRGGRGRGRGGLYPATVMMDAYGGIYVPLRGGGRGRGGFRGRGRGRGVYKPY